MDYDDQRRAHDDDRRRKLVDAAQQLDARYSVLAMYDAERQLLGYDYGNGQRGSELIRLRRERDAAITECHIYGYGLGITDLLGTPEQLAAELKRISSARLRRYRREAYLDRTARLAVEAWRRTAAEVARTVEAREAFR